VNTSGVGCPGRAARGGKAGEARLAVVTADGVFLGRLPSDVGAEAIQAGAGALVGRALRLAPNVSLPPSTWALIERARDQYGDVAVLRGIQALEHRHIGGRA
jgi:hypothetical protein